MNERIVDGRARFRCTLPVFYRRRQIAELAAKAGVLIPPATDVATDAPPALAFVNSLFPIESVARWLCRCPDCPGGTAYVWLETPIMFCITCGNRAIGGKFRPVLVPPDRATIEALLLLRPVERRNWEAYESLDKLRAENELLGVAT